MEEEVYLLSQEVDRLNTWDGLMSLLDRFYPVDVFHGIDDDKKLIALIREVDRLRKQEHEDLMLLEEAEALIGNYVISTYQDIMRRIEEAKGANRHQP